ncbi:MAG: 23S rRNA (adenine(2503)-C(2))-methyltransferase RlmN [Streptomycetaceae bacterium]|jgi:23S rRNA (adenine2503-C2)-methyltransferase|nr:23S rRNA (adenine(2503)-C(2))-methyltransferase RlmN [Streptomycetaceae bacterium]
MSSKVPEINLVFDEPVQRKKAPKHLADFAPSERKAFAEELGFPGYRASQVATHYFSHLSNDPQQWSDIPAESRQSISDALTPQLIELVTSRTTDSGMTRKDLWKLHDGVLVESVLMRYSDRVTVCISSQAGCGMNCPFCATGQAGLTRNLSAGEITEQIVAAARACANGELPGGPTRLSNIVFMGMGEPLANYNAVIRTVRNITDPNPDGLGISARSVTVSTVGLVNGIEKLTEEGVSVTLAVSLHTPDDELRDTLVPINNRFNIREVLAAADLYEKKTGRRYSIEYALIRDINDQSWRADLLGRLLKNRNAHVNLIPLNPTPGSKWTASRREDEAEFVRILESYGVPVTVRDTRGREIDGACGQLAAAEKASPTS